MTLRRVVLAAASIGVGFLFIALLAPARAAAESARPSSSQRSLPHLTAVHAGAAALGIAPSEIDAILAAGGEFHCSGRTGHNSATLNGWLLNGSGAVYTNSHAVLDARGELRAPLGECTFMSFARPRRKHPISSDPRRMRIGSAHPYQDDYRTDVARIPLVSNVPGARPLHVTFGAVDIAAGDELVLISRPPSMSAAVDQAPEPVMETCRVRAIDRQAGLPLGIVTSCFPTPGLSAGLYFARGAAGRLVPVAMVEGSDDKRNAARTCAIALDRSLLARLRSLPDIGGQPAMPIGAE
jgi:hypothetical protein